MVEYQACRQLRQKATALITESLLPSMLVPAAELLRLQEYWRYSYPLHKTNTVPAWAIPVLSTCGPTVVFVIWYVLAPVSRWEMHNLILGLLADVMSCALVTNLTKISVEYGAILSVEQHVLLHSSTAVW